MFRTGLVHFEPFVNATEQTHTQIIHNNKFKLHITVRQQSIRYDTIEEFNVDSKAEHTA